MLVYLQKARVDMRLNRYILLGIAFVGIFLFLAIPRATYQPATWSDPIDRTVRIHQFSKYTLPDNYKFVSYMDAMEDRKKFVAFKNKDTGQQIFIFILNELPKVKLSDLEISPKKIGRGYETYMQTIRGDTNFSLKYQIPFFIKKQMPEEYPNVQVRGLESSSREHFETDTTDVDVYKGRFTDLAFCRLSTSRFYKYPVPIFHAAQEMGGALAVINNKITHETIFAFGCNSFYKSFDEKEFIGIVKTITFDKEPKAIFGKI